MDLSPHFSINLKLDTLKKEIAALKDIHREYDAMMLFFNLIRLYKVYANISWDSLSQQYEKLTDDNEDGMITNAAFASSKAIINAFLPGGVTCDDKIFDFDYNLAQAGAHESYKLRRVVAQNLFLQECESYTFPKNMVGVVTKLITYLKGQQLRRMN